MNRLFWTILALVFTAPLAKSFAADVDGGKDMYLSTVLPVTESQAKETVR